MSHNSHLIESHHQLLTVGARQGVSSSVTILPISGISGAGGETGGSGATTVELLVLVHN